MEFDFLQDRKTGYSLPQAFFLSEDIFKKEINFWSINHWQYVGHESQISEVGSYLIFNFEKESIIVVRSSVDKISAFYNVCRHRGSRICLTNSGKNRLFVCPYHAWSYNLDGTLRAAREMPADFDKASRGLISCHVQSFHGMIFINLSADTVPDFGAFSSRFEPLFKLHDLRHTRTASQASFPTHANWKLLVENFIECYHCQNAHPTLIRFQDPGTRPRLGVESACTSATGSVAAFGSDIGHEFFEDGASSDNFQTGYISKIGFSSVTSSLDGSPVAPLLGARKFDGFWAYCVMNPLTHIALFPDHAIIYRFIPSTENFTEVEVSWLVRDTAKEGVDYDLEKLVAVWQTTLEEDRTIVTNNQLGVRSQAYEPGPYSNDEFRPAMFVEWYLDHVLGA